MFLQNFILFFGILAFSLMQNIVTEAVSVEEFLSLTTSEKAALDKFRAKVEPLLTSDRMKQDVYLIRWLRSKNFEVNAAEKMLRDSLKWRQDEKIDNIHLEDFSDMASEFHVTVDTYDKTGRPIGVIDMFDWDIRRAVLQGKGQRLLRFVIHFVENITNQVVERQERGMNVTQMIILMNTEGTNVIQQACPLCLPLWIQLVQTIDKYYPSYLHEFIIIEAPPTVNVLFETVRSFFSRDVRGIYHIYDTNKSKWMEFLDERISRDQRREKYGGTKPPFQY